MLSIITPLFNDFVDFKEQIASLHYLAHYDCEQIVINDGSMDCSIDQLQELADKAPYKIEIFQSVPFFWTANRGRIYSINRGYAESKWDVILVLFPWVRMSEENMNEIIYSLDNAVVVSPEYTSSWNNCHGQQNVLDVCFAFKNSFSPLPIDERLFNDYYDEYIYNMVGKNVMNAGSVFLKRHFTKYDKKTQMRINSRFARDVKTWNLICKENWWCK